MAVSLSFIVVMAMLMMTSQPTYSYDLTLGLLMPASFKNIAEYAIKQVNNKVFNDVNITAGSRWKEFKCDDIRPIGTVANEVNQLHGQFCVLLRYFHIYLTCMYKPNTYLFIRLQNRS